MSYTEKQQEFLNAALQGQNVYLTGKAGTGKSFITKELIAKLESAKIKYVAIAPTGIAANNIGGQTIHSLFGITPHGISSFDTANRLRSEKRRLLSNIKVIIVDEVSMLRPDILDAMNWTLIKNGCEPLVTKQIILIGDMAQLPPVLKDNDRSVLYQTYDGDDFTNAKVYKKINPITIELDEVVRQKDPTFVHHLNIIRGGGKSEYFRQFISNDTDGIILAPHNSTVAKYNEEGLAKEAGELFTFTAKIEGNVKADDFNLESVVNVKNGSKIMYLANSQNNALVNGTIGIFISHSDCHYIRVGNVDYALQRMQFTKKEYVYDDERDALVLRELGSIEQYPIKLAYALSIHKAQGMTFEKVTIDLTQPCFQKGQLYVALSRVTGPEGLRIKINE